MVTDYQKLEGKILAYYTILPEGENKIEYARYFGIKKLREGTVKTHEDGKRGL